MYPRALPDIRAELFLKVPYDKPVQALEMLNRWLSTRKL